MRRLKGMVLKMKKIAAFNMAAVILICSFTGFNSYATETISAPKTCEDYIKLANTYLQTDDVVQALAALDEGIEKLGTGAQGAETQAVDLLSQRKEYILAGTVAVGTNITTNRYHDDGSMYRSNISEYDESGKAISYLSENYDAAGEIRNTIEYQYDGNGNRIRYNYITYDNDGNSSISHYETWTYDEKGNQIEYVRYDEGNIIERTESEYDASGNEIRREEYDEDGNCTYKIIHNYDQNGNLILLAEYKDGSLKNRIEYEFDENNKERKAVFYDGDGNITRMTEYEYPENDRQLKWINYNAAGVVNQAIEYEYNENGNLIRLVQYNYNDDGSIDAIFDAKYDEIGREIYDGYEENDAVMATTEYDADGRKTSFYLCDSEEGYTYQSRTEYDKNGRMISYTGYDENENVIGRREKVYDASGNMIRENDYDADGSLIQYYENEYDDFGSVIRQAMYEDGILKTEECTSYAYHYIGNIDTEAADYMDNDMTPEEYNLKQREIFTRFLNGQEKVCFYRNDSDSKEGKMVEMPITDFLDYGCREGVFTYAFLDMTGDGIEELIIRCDSSIRIGVIQCSYGTLKVLYDVSRDLGERYGEVYLVKHDERMGIYRDCGATRNGDEWDEYYFWDEKGKKEIFIDESEYFDKSIGDYTNSYCMMDDNCFEGRTISKGEYYDIKDGMITVIDVDWQRLEEPAP